MKMVVVCNVHIVHVGIPLSLLILTVGCVYYSLVNVIDFTVLSRCIAGAPPHPVEVKVTFVNMEEESPSSNPSKSEDEEG